MKRTKLNGRKAYVFENNNVIVIVPSHNYKQADAILRKELDNDSLYFKTILVQVIE